MQIVQTQKKQLFPFFKYFSQWIIAMIAINITGHQLSGGKYCYACIGSHTNKGVKVAEGDAIFLGCLL